MLNKLNNKYISFQWKKSQIYYIFFIEISQKKKEKTFIIDKINKNELFLYLWTNLMLKWLKRLNNYRKFDTKSNLYSYVIKI